VTKRITVEYWAKTGSEENRVKHVFKKSVRSDMWKSLSYIGRLRFLQEQLWDDLECGFSELESSVPRNHE